MKLHGVTIDNESVFNQETIQINNNIMIFYKAKEEASGGFDFCVLESISYPMGDEDIKWTTSKDHEVESICEGYGYWDGVRHLCWYPNEEGYVNYPDLNVVKDICDALMKLEKKYCTESAWFDDECDVLI